jgi:hypothetical protein
MAKKYQSILFWFDGLFNDSIASLTLAVLKPELTGGEKITLRQKFQALHRDLVIGKINGDTYCQQAAEVSGVKTSSGNLVQSILEKSVLHQDFFDIYQQIAPEHDPKVIVDIPQIWFDQIVSHWKLAGNFPKDRLIITEQFNLQRIYPDIFYFIPQAIGKRMDECLLVDPQQMRAVAAHKLGLASATYVYPRRMKIDLAISGIWKTAEDVYHPKAGGRPNL